MPIFKSHKVIFFAKPCAVSCRPFRATVLALAAVGALLSCPARGDEDERIVTPLSLELTGSLRLPNNDRFDVYGLRLGVWVGEVYKTDVSGGGIGLLVMNSDKVRGIQLAGLGNTAKDMRGVQLGAFNGASNVYGVQVGFMNDYTCIAFSSFMDVYGVQVGVLNSARNVRGVQVGLVNDVTGYWAKKDGTDVRGLQIGIFNIATHLKGVQIGLLNWHGDDSFPFLRVGW